MTYGKVLAGVAAIALLTACSDDAADSSGDAPQNSDVAVLTGEANDTTNDDGGGAKPARLHVVEEYCIEYEHSGAMQSGTSKECIREWGMEQTRWENTTISMGAFSQTQNQRSITQGKTIVTFDAQTNQGTKMDNPYYDSFAQAAESDPKQFADQMIAAMGFSPNGETKEIAGETCNVLASGMGTMCMTEDGLTLETDIAGMVKKATKIDRSNGGADADYVVPENITFTEVPDLGSIMQGNMPQAEQ